MYTFGVRNDPFGTRIILMYFYVIFSNITQRLPTILKGHTQKEFPHCVLGNISGTCICYKVFFVLFLWNHHYFICLYAIYFLKRQYVYISLLK